MRLTQSGQDAIADKKLPDPYSAMGFLEPMLCVPRVKRVPKVVSVKYILIKFPGLWLFVMYLFMYNNKSKYVRL